MAISIHFKCWPLTSVLGGIALRVFYLHSKRKPQISFVLYVWHPGAAYYWKYNNHGRFFFFTHHHHHDSPPLLCLFSSISRTGNALNVGLLLMKRDRVAATCLRISAGLYRVALDWKYIIKICVWVCEPRVTRAARVKHLKCVVFVWPIDLSATSRQQCVTLRSRLEHFRFFFPSPLDLSDASISQERKCKGWFFFPSLFRIRPYQLSWCKSTAHG